MAQSKHEKDVQEYAKRVLPELKKVVGELKTELKKSNARPSIRIVQRLQALSNDPVFERVAGTQKGILVIIMLNLAKFLGEESSKSVMTVVPATVRVHILTLIKSHLSGM